MDIKRPIARQQIPLDAKMVFHGELFDVYQWEQEMFDGSKAIFEKLKRADTVSVIPVTPDNRIIIIEDEQPGRGSIITFPGGRCDKDENPADAAHRELMEETGYAYKELTLWKAWHPMSKVDWVLYFFVARGCEKVAEPHLDPGERISMKLVTLDELMKITDDERFPGQDMKLEFIEARYHAPARKKLEQLLFGA